MKPKKPLKDWIIAFLLTLCYGTCFYLQTLSLLEPIKGLFALLQAFICLIAAYLFMSHGFRIILCISALETIRYVMAYTSTHSIYMFNAIAIKCLIIIATYIVSYSHKQQLLELEKQKSLSRIDDLTQTFNRRFFQQQLHMEIEIANETHTNVGLILIDIDNFRLINDNFGHDYGDSVLIATANLLKAVADPSYYICRYGGDEFAIIIPDIDITALNTFSTDFKQLLSKNHPNYIRSPFAKSATLSMGLSTYPYMANDISSLIKQADVALYHAKNVGRDSLHIYEDLLSQLEEDITLENKHLIAVFKALLTCLSTKDPYTLGHCERVASYASKLAHYLGLSISEINTLYYAGLLHDIGKIEIPMHILNKTEPLTDEEYALIKMHPIYSANILEPLSDMYELVDYVKHHHERFDGRGYPDQKSGLDISFGARILAVADAFDAMVSDRPYGTKLTVDAALKEISRCSGQQFDPHIADAFIEMTKSSSKTALNGSAALAFV